jgi:hypothetical protein
MELSSVRCNIVRSQFPNKAALKKDGILAINEKSALKLTKLWTEQN